jgi:hypothetical protein
LGDWNREFSNNDFINYAVDGGHKIGLSNFDGKYTLGFKFNGQLIGVFGTSSTEAKNSAETLKKFYTDILYSIPFAADFDASNVLLSIVYFNDTDPIAENEDPETLIIESDDYIIFDIALNILNVKGIRPLGLRKKGVIVNPLTQNEELDTAAERINVRVDSSLESNKAIEIRMCDSESGEVLIDANGK